MAVAPPLKRARQDLDSARSESDQVVRSPDTPGVLWTILFLDCRARRQARLSRLDRDEDSLINE